MKYKNEYTKEIVFPLGGIGTGSVGLSGNGRLVDWEIFNRPNKMSINEYTHFAVKAESGGEVLDARILQGDTQKNFIGSNLSSHGSWGYGQGVHRASMAGLTHFRKTSFDGFYPIAEISYGETSFPGDISMKAWNPFVPGNDLDSSIPCAYFDIKVTNSTDKDIDYTLAFSCGNLFAQSRNQAVSGKGITGIFMDSETIDKNSKSYGNLMIATDNPSSWCQEYWCRGTWFDDVTTFWREFSSYGKIKNRHYDKWEKIPERKNDQDMGSLFAGISLKSGETGTVRFILSWYIPNVEKYWDKSEVKPMWKNYYAKRFSSAKEVSKYCLEEGDKLYKSTQLFRNTLKHSSLPEVVLDSIQGNLAILKSSTCLRLENGEFWAWEGVNQSSGSCEGSCAHVWNYAYALPFLFPKLERSMREIEYTYNITPMGELKFRTMLPLGSKRWDFRACVDGQFGGIIKFYREWKICGDDNWLKRYWPAVKKTLEYAWHPDNPDKWDINKTGVITGRQHHTLDMELFGPNSWLTGFYLAALKAAAEIADYLGETTSADEYLMLFNKGKEYLETELFNGKHYIQKIDITDNSILTDYEDTKDYWNDETGEIKYQYVSGCEIDQMVAQWHASLVGLGDIFDITNRLKALETIYRLNFKSMRELNNPCRVFSVDDEKGAIICEWEELSEKPKIPLPYTEETMTGFEYALAGLMLQNDMQEKALEIISAVRDRYDGHKRNPWSEIECGSSYARAMASYSFLLVYSGFVYAMGKKMIGFAPLHKPNADKTAKYFWSVGSAWGEVAVTDKNLELIVLCGLIELNELMWYGENVLLCESIELMAEGISRININLP